MPTKLEDWAQPDTKDRQTSANEEAAKPVNASHNVGAKMPSYIGTKIVCATPMDECSFLTTYKGQDTSNRETQPGYFVVYEDGYKSWSPKETFERAYRLITPQERALI